LDLKSKDAWLAKTRLFTDQVPKVKTAKMVIGYHGYQGQHYDGVSGPLLAEHVAIDFKLYSPYAGRVELHYSPGSILRVATHREVRVRTGAGGP